MHDFIKLGINIMNQTDKSYIMLFKVLLAACRSPNTTLALKDVLQSNSDILYWLYMYESSASSWWTYCTTSSYNKTQ